VPNAEPEDVTILSQLPENFILGGFREGTKLGAGGNGEVSSAVNMKGEVIAIKRSLKQLKDEIKDTLKFSLDFHLEASKDEYANNHIGKLFLYNLRGSRFYEIAEYIPGINLYLLITSANFARNANREDFAKKSDRTACRSSEELALGCFTS